MFWILCFLSVICFLNGSQVFNYLLNQWFSSRSVLNICFPNIMFWFSECYICFVSVTVIGVFLDGSQVLNWVLNQWISSVQRWFSSVLETVLNQWFSSVQLGSQVFNCSQSMVYKCSTMFSINGSEVFNCGSQVEVFSIYYVFSMLYAFWVFSI